MKNQDRQMLIFKFLVAVTIAALAVGITLIVFSFMNVAQLEMLHVLLVVVSIAVIVVLCSLTVWQGLKVYRD